MAEQEEDFSSLPLTERFGHKIWKVRKAAYEDAAKQFERTPDESDPTFKPFLQDTSLMKGAVADSNVAAQQDGIAALCAFLKYGGAQAGSRTRQSTVSILIEKGLCSTRAASKASSLEALMLYIELDAPGPILEELIPSLSHKQPKVIAATLSTLTSIFHAYGCKTADPKPVLKSLPRVFSHADKNVRAESQNLAVELYRWLKEAMKPVFWNDLKPVQQQDLEKSFEKVKEEPPPKQERFLQSQQAAGIDAQGEEDAAEADDADDQLDGRDLAEAVDVFANIPNDLQDNLSSTKWKDRKDALDALYQAVNVPKIKEGDFNEIMRSLAKCMKDANIAVVTVAANCIEAIAKGLQRSAGRYRQIVLSPIMERLKEKKQSVTDALAGALDAVFESTGLSDCLEETMGFLSHKNPQVRLESVRFLIRCLKNTRDVPPKSELKSISEAATKLLTESTEVLRSAAAEILGVLMKIVGERAMSPYMEGLDDIRKTKIKEYCDAAQVKAKEKPKPAPAAPKAAAPTGKKPAPGKKAPAGLKKPAPAAAPPAEDHQPPQPPKSASKPATSRLAGPPKAGGSVSGSNLKLQKRLAGPGATPASPKRAPAAAEPEEQQTPSAPKFGTASRGLAGRPLGRPAPAHSNSSDQTTARPSSSGMSSVDRTEFEELKAERERSLRQIEELRGDKSKLNSQIHELQNHNAQLIEDHTRDVLSIKAKETQLVRARSDAEAAEQQCQKQQREIERLKRELSRAVRASSPPSADPSDQIYRDSGMHDLSSRSGGASAGRNRPASTGRPSYNSTLSEEKENGSYDTTTYRQSKLSPPLNGDGQFDSELTSRGGSARGSSRGSSRDAHGAAAGNGEGVESWKRAAEVTNRLKARIEQMKASQGISKPE